MPIISCISKILVIIGGLNWGLVGFFDFNLVERIFGADSIVAQIIYCLVGIAALVIAVMIARGDCLCGSSCQCAGKEGSCHCHKDTEEE
ncbi:MAG: DUF378 domain-containing protein [Alphaproteobacteria bacterium]|nr:DUF378 domain-containing protein [Alphaproteobacteria bacterium]